MPSVTRRPAQAPEHREAVVGQVAAAVERLLEEGHGYTALGVQRIADEAGIARSTFYLYFPDKSALLIRVTRAATAELFGAAGAWLDAGFGDRDALEDALAGVIAQQREHAALLAAVTEVAGYDEQVAAFWRGEVGAFIDRLRRRIEQGIRAREVTADLDPETTASWIAWGTERLLGQHVATRPQADDARLASGLAAAVRATLGR